MDAINELCKLVAGIDAAKKCHPFGTVAKAALSTLVMGKPVTVQSSGKDRYGRTIADVFRGSEWVNHEMVQSGFAWRYVQYSKDARLIEAETSALTAKRGVGRSSPGCTMGMAETGQMTLETRLHLPIFILALICQCNALVRFSPVMDWPAK